MFGKPIRGCLKTPCLPHKPLLRSQPHVTIAGLHNDIVLALYNDGAGSLWIGTSGGLTRLKDERLTSYTTAHGLFGDVVFQILEDAKNNLWMSCNKGVFRISKAELDDFAMGKSQQIRPKPLSRSGKSVGLYGQDTLRTRHAACAAAGSNDSKHQSRHGLVGWRNGDYHHWKGLHKGGGSYCRQCPGHRDRLSQLDDYYRDHRRSRRWFCRCCRDQP